MKQVRGFNFYVIEFSNFKFITSEYIKSKPEDMSTEISLRLLDTILRIIELMFRNSKFSNLASSINGTPIVWLKDELVS